MSAGKPRGGDPKPEHESTEEQRQRLEAQLDAALEATFPASDAIALATPPAPVEGDPPEKGARSA